MVGLFALPLKLFLNKRQLKRYKNFNLDLSDGLCYTIIMKILIGNNIMTCGIYLGYPVASNTGDVYIGQSVTLEERVQRHNSQMRKGLHTTKMQDAYNKYGEFTWEILEECSIEQLDALERYYINLFDSYNNGLNTYENSSQAPILYGEDNGNANLDRFPIYLKIIENTLVFPNKTKREIALLSNATIDEVKSLWLGLAYKWIEKYIPKQYNEVMELQGNRQTGGRTSEQQGKKLPILLSPDFIPHLVKNIREFGRQHNLDKADLNNVLNLKTASVGGWIVKDLDILYPDIHKRFYSTNRGRYKKQFDAYTSTKK